MKEEEEEELLERNHTVGFDIIGIYCLRVNSHNATHIVSLMSMYAVPLGTTTVI